MHATRTSMILCLALAVQTALSGATYTVTNTDDSGLGSLRDAIEWANANEGPDLIVFDISGTGPQTIFPVDALPDITDAVIIDGYTQPGTSLATDTSPATLNIVLDGSSSSGATGLVVRGAENCTIRGLRIQDFANDGIGLEGNHNSVEGNHISYSALVGIYIAGEHNVIGGVTSAQRNVINGGNVGIGLFPGATHNHIEGNYVGTTADGQSDDGFHGYEGVAIGGSSNTVANNLISGYDGEIGVSIQQWEGNPIPEDNVVEGNQIGTDVYGDPSIPNGLGILIDKAVRTTIRGNLIAGNRFAGIEVRNDVSLGNTITRNAIYDNGELGINLVRTPDDPGWVTPNDPGDIDVGPNNLMNFPVLTSALATPGQLIVRGVIDTPNPTSVRLEFFANSTPDSSDCGEGEIYLGAAKPNATGAFTAALPAVLPGMYISATATDRDGNTSEFCLCIEATGLVQP